MSHVPIYIYDKQINSLFIDTTKFLLSFFQFHVLLIKRWIECIINDLWWKIFQIPQTFRVCCVMLYVWYQVFVVLHRLVVFDSFIIANKFKPRFFIFEILVLLKNAANHFNDNFSGSLLRILSLQCTRWNTSSFYIHQWSAAIKKSEILITFFFPMIYSKQNNTFIFGTNYALVTFPAILCQKLTVFKCHA